MSAQSPRILSSLGGEDCAKELSTISLEKRYPLVRMIDRQRFAAVFLGKLLRVKQAEPKPEGAPGGANTETAA